jgi:DNA-binding GntR family transcriptional regulator
VEPVSDLPMVDDIDADYSPQYVKLARVLRDKITSGEHKPGDPLPVAVLAGEYQVSAWVAVAALDMLAANRYIARPARFRPYRVTWSPPGAQQEEPR